MHAVSLKQKQNVVLLMIQNELEMDLYYLPELNVILVRIDQHSIEHPILAEW